MTGENKGNPTLSPVTLPAKDKPDGVTDTTDSLSSPIKTMSDSESTAVRSAVVAAKIPVCLYTFTGSTTVVPAKLEVNLTQSPPQLSLD
eukprot:CAMPEP_0197456924 /NCGR_PEP_ID=MMETSP1175-20131217/44663_1 /TAXON_ID=1003142 /ORGANISM="Triceratium dubium, Strain CCMP147" /LENGTH=88 /DNA_ID=CAMNT_0042991137 /DNA_START=34 /DNA_END=298 /DNA_ORIENTATION=+